MEIIGENMHIMDPVFLGALTTKDSETLLSLARQQAEAGATALDINLGQSKYLTALTPWLINTIQAEVDLPLFMSSHVLHQPDMLKTHKGIPVINAVTANSDELKQAMKIANNTHAGLVILLVSSKLTPGDINGRLILADQVMDVATTTGMPLSRLYLDPVISCSPDPASWRLGGGQPDMEIIYESLSLLKEMSPHWKTIVGLSNASIYLSRQKRSAQHCSLLPKLADSGLDAVILNPLDDALMEVAKELNTSKLCTTKE